MDTPEIKISDVNPGEKPLERASATVTSALRYTLDVKTTREKLVEQVKNSVAIPLVDQECILARIAAIDAKHDLLWLTAACSPHKAGCNFTFTVCEL